MDNNTTYIPSKLGYALGGLGFALGLYLAYRKDKHFLGYVGFGLLFSLIGTASGNTISTLTNQ
jgi:hypothetical protein